MMLPGAGYDGSRGLRMSVEQTHNPVCKVVISTKTLLLLLLLFLCVINVIELSFVSHMMSFQLRTVLPLSWIE